MNILQARSKARRWVQTQGIKILVCDYLQLFKGASRRSSENRQEEISEISSGFKALAKELKIPVILLAQLNREIEKEKGRRPRMSDLRESGAIEQDADLIGMLWEAEESEPGSPIRRVNLEIVKQRNGPTGPVPFVFRRDITRFESASPVDEQG
jgi:replicative DNA helicase